jgi:hypothetical protein
VPKGKASLNLKRALWGDKPEGLLPENCPNFFFFFCLGRVILIMTTPDKVGYFNYDKIFEFTRLWLILIMTRFLKEVRPNFGLF